MKTKVFYFISTLLLFSSLTMAQETERGRASFAILGGVNMQNFTGKDYTGDQIDNDMITGYHVGANIQIPIVPQFYIQPGLLYTKKGSINKGDVITSTYNLSYVELPINFVYKGALGNGFIMLGFGPYVAYGVGGTAKYEGGPISYESDVVFTDVVEEGDPIASTYYKAFDAGGNIFVGYEMAAGIFLQLNTQFGMVNINPEDKHKLNDETAVKNTGFGLSVGYRF